MSEHSTPTVAQVAEELGLKVCAGGHKLDSKVEGALVSDLLSFVMANGKRGQLWVTIQTHSNIVAVAVLGGLAGIIIASGFHPDEDTTGRAEEEDIPILTCDAPAYEVAGMLYELGVR
ncbi:MAG: serine kinase [Armatimonadetes bacterium]|nr:serine kinase [Armatimonadota bacterium]MDI9583598.1 DRTGG domain-containing protein [Acidobacteriota bacterium]